MFRKIPYACCKRSPSRGLVVRRTPHHHQRAVSPLMFDSLASPFQGRATDRKRDVGVRDRLRALNERNDFQIMATPRPGRQTPRWSEVTVQAPRPKMVETRLLASSAALKKVPHGESTTERLAKSSEARWRYKICPSGRGLNCYGRRRRPFDAVCLCLALDAALRHAGLLFAQSGKSLSVTLHQASKWELFRGSSAESVGKSKPVDAG